jgi:hypothetical protein
MMMMMKTNDCPIFCDCLALCLRTLSWGESTLSCDARHAAVILSNRSSSTLLVPQWCQTETNCVPVTAVGCQSITSRIVGAIYSAGYLSWGFGMAFLG